MNRQRQQSEQWLTEALLNLMQQKAYREISITEICKKADLSRRTFYRLYQSKEDILFQYIDLLCQSYLEKFEDRKDVPLTAVATIFFSFWKEHQTFLLLLHRENLTYLLLLRFNKLLPDVYVTLKSNMLHTNDVEKITYIAFYNAGGFWNVLFKWLEDDCKKEPEELSSIVGEVFHLK